VVFLSTTAGVEVFRTRGRKTRERALFHRPRSPMERLRRSGEIGNDVGSGGLSGSERAGRWAPFRGQDDLAERRCFGRHSPGPIVPRRL